jgi:methyltransferase
VKETEQLFLALLLALYAERLLELVVSRRNVRRLLARGATEFGRRHFPPMAVLHALFPAAAFFEVIALERPFPGLPGFLFLGVFLLAQGLRWWSVITLGRLWNVRIVVPPHTELEVHGPYRFLRHPNYLAVVMELAAVPLIHGAWITALVASLLNGWLLAIRIPLEEQALGSAYATAFADRSRLLPRRRHDSP